MYEFYYYICIEYNIKNIHYIFMKRKFSSFFVLLFVMMTVGLTSCSKDVMLESDDEGEKANSTLIVRTRAEAGDEGSAKISYPVTVYLFDASNSCVAVSSISKADDKLSLKLVKGMYTICAVAGAVSDDYVLPSAEKAQKNSVVSLKQDKSHADLMSAVYSVNVKAGETNTLELVMKRKVMMLENVTVKNVPDDVTDVSVTILPLYENLCLDGTYSGTNGSQTIDLSKEEDTNVWKNTDEVYMLEAAGNATVTVSFTSAEGTKSYSYSLADELKANYKITLEGTYVSNEGVLISGTMTGEEWAGERTISFEFGEGSNDNGGAGNDNPVTGENTVTGEAPAAGTIYSGCYVVSNTTNDDGSTTVVLMSGKHVIGLAFDASDQTSVSEAVSQGIAELAVDGIDGWRLPTLTEIKNVVNNNSTINKLLSSDKAYDTIVSGVSFFYQESDGNISSYCKMGNAEFNSATRLRAFATVTFK